MPDLVELFFVALFNALAFSQFRQSPWRSILLLLFCIPINTAYGLSYAASATVGSSRWVEGFVLGIPLGCLYLGIVFWTILRAGQKKKPPFGKRN